MSITTDMSNRGAEAFQRFADQTVMRDGRKAYLGTDGDESSQFNIATGTALHEGVPSEFDGGIARKTTTTALDLAATAAQCKNGLIIVSVTGRTVTLPAAFLGGDVVVAPVGAITTTVELTAGSFGTGGGGYDVATVAIGTAAHLVAGTTDGGTTWVWFLVGVPTLA